MIHVPGREPAPRRARREARPPAATPELPGRISSYLVASAPPNRTSPGLIQIAIHTPDARQSLRASPQRREWRDETSVRARKAAPPAPPKSALPAPWSAPPPRVRVCATPRGVRLAHRSMLSMSTLHVDFRCGAAIAASVSSKPTSVSSSLAAAAPRSDAMNEPRSWTPAAASPRMKSACGRLARYSGRFAGMRSSSMRAGE